MVALTQFRALMGILARHERRGLYFQVAMKAALGILDPLAILLMGLTVSLLVAGPDSVPDSYKGVYVTFGVAEPNQAAERLRLILAFAIAVLFLFTLKACLGLVVSWRVGVFASRLEAKYAFKWANAALKNPAVITSDISTEAITHALTSGVSAVFQRTMTALANLISEISVMVLMTGMLLVVQPILVISAVLYFGAIAWVMHFWLGRRMESRSRVHAQMQIKTFESISSLVKNYRELFLSGRLGSVTNQFGNLRLQASRALSVNVFLASLPRYALETGLIFGAFLLAIIEFKSLPFASAIPVLTMFLAAASRITPSLITVLNCVAEVRGARPDFERTLVVLGQATSGSETLVNE